MGAWFHEDNRGECQLICSYSRHTATAITKAAQSAHRLIDLAEADGLDGYPPVFNQEAQDKWWTEVFGDTEQELIEQRTAIAKRYKRLSFWQRSARRETLEAYVRIDQMLTTGHGLESVWR